MIQERGQTIILPPIEAYRIVLAQKCLADFVKQSWAIVEPEKLLQWNWHHDAMCEYLEAVAACEIRNLLITVPPRHTKSTITSICLPPWLWTTQPSIQFLYASHDSTLSTEHSVKCRRIVESEWYLERWGHRCLMAEDQNQKTKFENTAGGYRTATSVGGSVIGKGGDIVVVDDPHKVEEAETDSLATLKATLSWFDGTLSTRLNDPKTSRRIIIMQRIHETDLAGHVLKKKDWEHLNLPTIAEKKTVVAMPRTEAVVREDGDLLWQDRFGPDEVATAKEDLGSFGFAAQHQQRPSPRGGGIIKREWWQYYDEEPICDFKIQSWDTAFKKGQENDYSCCLTFGVFAKGYAILDFWRGRLQFPELKRLAVSIYDGEDGVRAVLIEDAASGQDLIPELERETKLPIIACPTKGKDKVLRLNTVSPTIEAGKVWLPKRASWLAGFTTRVDRFPNGDYDDDVDSLSQALRWLADHVKRGPRIRTL